MRAAQIAAVFAFLPVLTASAADEGACKTRTFEEQLFTVCSADLARHEVRMFWRQRDGTNYSHLEALPRAGLVFATNAGMFTPEYAPAGLYVENGEEFTSLNTRSGAGNFHVQPNGVFWVKDDIAAVSTTQAYAAQSPEPDSATQSGPMLVIAGAINAKFDSNGVSRYIRNGVGVADASHVYFAISQAPVSFGVFARLFRDELHCPNALYLDGSLSRIFDPAVPSMRGLPLGPLIGVYVRE